MANNYTEFSCFLDVPSKKMDKAFKIMNEEIIKLEEGTEGYCGFSWEKEDDGIWIHSDESGTPEHVETCVRAIMEKLKLDTVFECSWCYHCDKMRVGEFGGGAFVMKYGKETVWVDAVNMAHQQLEKSCH